MKCTAIATHAARHTSTHIHTHSHTSTHIHTHLAAGAPSSSTPSRHFDVAERTHLEFGAKWSVHKLVGGKNTVWVSTCFLILVTVTRLLMKIRLPTKQTQSTNDQQSLGPTYRSVHTGGDSGCCPSAPGRLNGPNQVLFKNGRKSFSGLYWFGLYYYADLANHLNIKQL